MQEGRDHVAQCYLPIRRNPSQVCQMDCIPAATSLAFSGSYPTPESALRQKVPETASHRCFGERKKDKPRSLSNFTASYSWLETSPGPFCPKIFIRYFPQLPGHAVLEHYVGMLGGCDFCQVAGSLKPEDKICPKGSGPVGRGWGRLHNLTSLPRRWKMDLEGALA